MKFANVRELKNKTSEILRRAEVEDVIITSQGKPRAIITSITEDNFEDYLARRNQGGQEASGPGGCRLSTDQILEVLNQNSKEIKKRYQVKRLGLFGSRSRGQGGPGSDIDLLVEFKRPSFDNYMDLKFFLEEILSAEVDLIMADTLKQRLKPYVMEEIQYADGF